jgi:hypothetical protein
VAPPGLNIGQHNLTYGATLEAPDCTLGNWFPILVSNALAHHLPAPIHPIEGKTIFISFFNFSGGVIATATFDSSYHMAVYTPPAPGFFTSAMFISNSALIWYQVTPWAPAVI